jgi:hypothetical protein
MLMRLAVAVGAAALTAVVAPRPAAAQLDGLLPGTQVRVVGTASSLRGTFHSIGADTLRVAVYASGAPVAIALRNIVELRAVQPRSRVRGAAFGAAVGAAILASLLVVDCWTDYDECRTDYELPADVSGPRALQEAAFVGAVGGGALAAAIGALWPGTREVKLWLPPAALALVELSAGGSAAGAVLRARIATGR